MNDSVALFITWTTYGTWLPGDERGHVSNILRPEGGFLRKRNRPQTSYALGDDFTRDHARRLQKWPTVRLTAADALVVANSLVKVAIERNWMILRAAVMANHVHAVVTACPIKGFEIRRHLKGRAQAELSAAAGEARRWWTAGGSDRVRCGERSIAATVEYVANQRGKLAEIIDNVLVVAARDDERRG